MWLPLAFVRASATSALRLEVERKGQRSPASRWARGPAADAADHCAHNLLQECLTVGPAFLPIISCMQVGNIIGGMTKLLTAGVAHQAPGRRISTLDYVEGGSTVAEQGEA